MAVRTPIDSDMWWHLRVGEETVKTRQVYQVDTLSFTRNGAEWLNHSWLAQILIFSIYQVGGYPLLSLWVAAAAVLSLWLTYKQMEGPPLGRAPILLLAGIVASVNWAPRPQVISLVFFSLVGYLLYLWKWKGSHHLHWLAPIFMVWANMHGGFALGLILIGAVIAGEAVNLVFFELREQRKRVKEIVYLGQWLIAAGLLICINPYGAKLWGVPFQTVGIESLQNLIQEWASPDFHQLFQQPMIWLIIGLIGAVGASNIKIDGTEWAAAGIFLYSGLLARRNFGPFALVSAPILYRHARSALSSWREAGQQRWPWIRKLTGFQKRSDRSMPEIWRAVINVAVVVILLASVGIKLFQVTKPDLIQALEGELFPVEIVEYMESRELQGKIFNDYNWGGYLVWTLRDSQIFVDGRTDLYGDEIITDWWQIINIHPGWDELLNEYQADYLLISDDWPLGRIELKDWQVIYRREGQLLFEKQP